MENHVGPTTYCLEAWNMVKLHIQGNQWKVCEITLFFYINIYIYMVDSDNLVWHGMTFFMKARVKSEKVWLCILSDA